MSPSTLILASALVFAFFFLKSRFLTRKSILKSRLLITRKTKSKKSLLLPPGPKPWPFIGNLPEIYRNKPVFRWIMNVMKEMNTDMACVRLGNVHVIVVNCPELGREFLKKHDAVFASRPVTVVTKYMSCGFLSTAVVPLGEQWKKMRRVVASQIVNPARLRWLVDKRTEEADNMVRYVYNQNGSVIDVRLVARQYCGNVIRKMMFNKRSFGERKEDGGSGIEEQEHVDAIFDVLSLIYSFSVSDYLPWLRLVELDLEGDVKRVKEVMGVISKYHDPIIDGRVEQWRNGRKEEVEDLLDVLISLKDDNGKPLLSTQEIKAQTAEIMLATVDNPSNAVEWAMAEMINKPEFVQRAVEEIDRVVGKERLVQESDIPHLNYVKACAREAFRLHPMVPFNLPHVSSSDTTVAGYFIPKGSHVLLSRVGLGRNPKVWEEPLKFKPERHFTDGKTDQVELTEPELRFISFSTGRRGCPGVALGSAMTVVLLARLLQGFTWRVPPNESIIDLTESKTELALAKPLHLHATPRLSVDVYPTN